MSRRTAIFLKEFLAAVFLILSVGVIVAPLQLLLERVGFREYSFSIQMVDKLVTFVAVVLFMGVAFRLHYDASAERVLRRKSREGGESLEARLDK